MTVNVNAWQKNRELDIGTSCRIRIAASASPSELRLLAVAEFQWLAMHLNDQVDFRRHRILQCVRVRIVKAGKKALGAVSFAHCSGKSSPAIFLHDLTGQVANRRFGRVIINALHKSITEA